MAPRLRRWTDEKLERELMFAELCVDATHEATITWLDSLVAEKARRDEKEVSHAPAH
jgi:hypothetical protein